MYKVFTGNVYYAGGGYSDFLKGFNTLEEARKCVEEEYDADYDWYQIVHEDVIIERSANQAHT